MEKAEKEEHGEIIIVKRGGGDHDEHHGGVWKIAFADFMTAMMAFFLVMWLINASNEQTRKAVASYFNPIKLMDTTSNPKGVKNPKYGVEQQNIEEEEESTKVTNPVRKLVSEDAASKTFSEQALFVDPFALLSEIEGGIVRDGKTPAPDSTSKENKRGMALNGGVSFQDPFDPSVWNIGEGNSAEDEVRDAENSGPELKEGGIAETTEADNRELKDAGQMLREEHNGATQGMGQLALNDPSEGLKPSEELKKELQEKIEAALNEQAEAKEVDENIEESEMEEEKTEVSDAKDESGAFPEESQALASELEAKVNALKEETGVYGLDLEVQVGKSGAAVVLSDNNQNGMFSIGSARPTPELVRVMKEIGDVISKHDGNIEISGHTDGRKYQSGDYDNWRLSTARAHMAYYMLVRGGMQEAQVEKIVGQADVRLKVPDNPFSASNRRIEVLLKVQ